MPGREFHVHSSEQGERLVDVLANRLRTSKREAKRLLDAGNVFVNRRSVWMAKHKLRPSDVVQVAALPDEQTIQNHMSGHVCFEDEHFMIINKPARLLSAGSRSIEQRLQREMNNDQVFVAHRLDQDTSGCLLVAKHERAFQSAEQLFRDQAVDKTYRAIVHGRLTHNSGTIRKPIDDKRAVTFYRVLQGKRNASYLELSPKTGRTHQLRRHLAAIGHPVVADRTYGCAKVTEEETQIPRQMLHAKKLKFSHPMKGTTIAVETELPSDFVEALRMFELH